jgi:asparagine synthase (glutamine-hydrolysing)
MIHDQLLGSSFIKDQGIFNVETVESYKKQLHGHSPGDVHARIWALIVFQWWWKKYFI